MGVWGRDGGARHHRGGGGRGGLPGTARSMTGASASKSKAGLKRVPAPTKGCFLTLSRGAIHGWGLHSGRVGFLRGRRLSGAAALGAGALAAGFGGLGSLALSTRLVRHGHSRSPVGQWGRGWEGTGGGGGRNAPCCEWVVGPRVRVKLGQCGGSCGANGLTAACLGTRMRRTKCTESKYMMPSD